MTDNKDEGKIEEYAKLQILKREAEKLQELDLKNKLINIYSEAYQYKLLSSKNWDEYIQLIRGTHWPKRRAAHRISAVINFLVENIERKTALLTDAKPIPKITPRSQKFQDTANIANQLMSIIFQSSQFGQANADLIENSQVFGSGFINTLYDKSTDHSRGDIRISSFDPRAIYIDPLVRKSYLLCEGEYVIIEDVWPIEKARDIYTKKADQIHPDAGLSAFRSDQDRSFFAQLKNKVLKPFSPQILQSEIPRVYVREYWIKDRSKDENGKFKFKNASRKIVMVGEVITDDGDNPYNDGDFPTDMLIWHTDFNSGWGWGDVELLENPQKLQDKIIATIIENIMLMSNAIWIGDADALSKEDWMKLNNAPGTYVKKKPGRELHREPGVALPAHVVNTIEYLERSSEKISGMVDVMRGIRTGQVSSGVGIESLQLMAQALIRLRARSLEALQARVGRKLLSRIFQFYGPKKIFEVLRSQQEDLTEAGLNAFSSELLKPISSREPTAWLDIIFEIEPGSSLGLAETQHRIESTRLFELGVIDDVALLEDLKYPNRDKVLKRMQKRKLNEAEAQTPPDPSRASRFPQQAGASPKGRF
uniref:Uncharacterized protein n=1 Tax=viral metagenome TaxID=1070528 RepID=A0A6M3J6T5_9ZZZZ